MYVYRTLGWCCVRVLTFWPSFVSGNGAFGGHGDPEQDPEWDASYVVRVISTPLKAVVNASPGASGHSVLLVLYLLE